MYYSIEILAKVKMIKKNSTKVKVEVKNIMKFELMVI